MIIGQFYKVFLLLPLNLAHCAEALQASYEVLGRGETDGAVLAGHGSRWKFEVSVNGCRWAITVSHITDLRSEPLTNIRPDYMIATCDGEQYYFLRSYATATMAIPNASHSADARVAPDWEPVLPTREMKALWWLYASHCVLATNTGGHLPMLDVVSPEMYRSGSQFLPGQLERLSGPPGLPRVVQVGRTASDILAHGKPLNSAGRALKGERLEVSETIGIGEVVLPKYSQVDYFLSLSSTQPWISISVQAEEVRDVITRDSYIPKIRERTSVDSAHFWKDNPPQFAWISTNRWPAPHEFRKAPIRSELPSHRTTPKVWLWLMVCLLAGGPTILVAKLLLAKKGQHT
jgi:hypothetical protein